ncbi:serine hydrolase domain-containing protein [Tenuifilum thalassicum]|uniref:Beta-lactamase family protein n=1 Tax=Tenuifilum thalassicum TaxID=2590900 RepID=A0A7D3XM20_9BACT|nr:serine hydrolase domain-containing protein [Tenuifilum thalassicum]QKG79876.1 beta-lactamase family protein [Tenuifilum thalassicum]
MSQFLNEKSRIVFWVLTAWLVLLTSVYSEKILSKSESKTKPIFPEINVYAISNRLTDSHEYSQLNDRLSRFVKRWEVTGATFCITRNGRLIYARSFGWADKEDSLPLEPYHVMRVASVSKLITATAVFKLIESGKLDLGDKVFGKEGILNQPQFLGYKDKRVEDITILNLLNHSGGWTTRWGDHMFIGDVISKELGKELPLSADDYIVFALSKPLHFQPGSRSSYCNIGYVILQRVIEAISGMDYESYVKAEIFEPLNIHDAHISNNWDSLRFENEVRYYEVPEADSIMAFDGSIRKVPRARGGNDVHVLGAAGGWVISPLSLTRFALAIDGKKSFPDILSAKSIESMRNTFNGQFHPLGWRWVHGDGTLWRSGSMAGTSALVVCQPDGYTFTFVANHSPWKGARFPYIVDRYLKRIFPRYIEPLPQKHFFLRK